AVQIFEASARAEQKSGRAHTATNGGQHGSGHGAREALPWWGMGLLFGWCAYGLLGSRLLDVLGILALDPHGGQRGTHLEPGFLAATIIRGLERLGLDAHWLPTLCLTLFLGAGLLACFWLAPLVNRVLAVFFRLFNATFDAIGRIYGQTVRGILRVAAIPLLAYAVLMFLTWLGFRSVPVGFVPSQDKGYLIVSAQLPDGASLGRTEAVMDDAAQTALQIPGVTNAISIPGFSLLTGSNISNTGTMFLTLAPFSERRGHPGQSANAILGQLYAKYGANQDALILPLNAPPVDGIGNSGGIKLQVKDQVGQGSSALQQVAENLGSAGVQAGVLVGAFSTFRAHAPRIFLKVDRAKAISAGVRMEDINATLGTYLGSAYANDFTYLGRSWQVNLQADAPYRMLPEDIRALKVRNNLGMMAPLGGILEVREVTGPALITRYNMFPSADLNGIVRPGVSSGQALATMEQITAAELPNGMTYEWTELSLQEKLTGNSAIFVFLLGAVFVYLVLASLYESWLLPLAIILILPMCLFAAIAGIWWMRGDNNIFTQIGLVVLIGLASKNAILIVEFARELRRQGKSLTDATVEACRMRLRPIIMTSAAFILGVIPLVRSSGAGAEMRYALGLAVFSGMLGVTLFGLVFTPVFYWVLSRYSERSRGNS
ncbi:MAG TPA: efflux RND transporter permease subunit, partial [Pirellulaceae bacterium]